MPLLSPGDRLGGFLLRRRLSVGGMGELWVAASPDSSDVVVKVQLPELSDSHEHRAMFLDECDIAARLEHPNIVKSYGGYHGGNQLFQVIEFIDGIDLQRLLSETKHAHQTLAIPLILRVGHEVAMGLSYAHELRDTQDRPLGLVHRDISPANILLSGDGRVLVIDFGIAKARQRLSRTATGVIKGKLGYLAPELLAGRDVTPSVDIFGLGIVLWEMAALRRLFSGSSDLEIATAVQAGGIPDLESMREDAPDELCDLVRWMLEADPVARPESMGRVRDALAGMLKSWPEHATDARAIAAAVTAFSAKPSMTAQLPVPDLGAIDLADTLVDPAEHEPTERHGPKPADGDQDATVPLEPLSIRKS